MVSDIDPQKITCENCGLTISGFDILNVNYCVKCAHPTQAWMECIDNYFYRTHHSKYLLKAIDLFKKSEFTSAARLALIIVEERAKDITKLDRHGKDLFSAAFSYKVDNGTLRTKPLIQINQLITEQDINEHEGIKLYCMGLMSGIRNILAHNSADIRPKTCLSIISTCDLVIDILESGSILNERVCIWEKVED